MHSTPKSKTLRTSSKPLARNELAEEAEEFKAELSAHGFGFLFDNRAAETTTYA
ncbi:hypothetical protein [Hyphomicrobium sp.]|uniref:hypothetical protein n=1 Tax=Hyphomicrobium sp. TaxID=82 RepID=UPI0035676A9E